MTPPGRSKGYAPDSDAVRAARRRPKRFGASPLLLSDANLRGLLPELPSQGTDPPVPDVLNQLATDTCVPHVIAQGIRCLAKRDSLPVVMPSRLAIYWEAMAAMGDTSVDQGIFPSAAFGAIDSYGLAPEAAWAFDPARVLDPPDDEVYRLGYDSRGALVTAAITDARGLRETEIRDHLNHQRPIALGVQVDTSFERGDSPLWTPSGDVLGGHYVLGLQSTAEGLYCLSSWGIGFCDLGGITIPWAILENPLQVTDLVAMERLIKSPGA